MNVEKEILERSMKLMGWDLKFALVWYTRANPALQNRSPLELVMEGKASQVLDLLQAAEDESETA